MREICARRLRFLLRVFLADKVYPDWEHAKYHPGVGYVVHVLRWVAAGQIISGKRDLPSAEMYSIAVTIVRLTPAPL
jgi:hypothetical protein